MTQVSRYGHMLKVSVTRMTMHVKASFRVTGSVLDDTIEGEMLGAETRLEYDRSQRLDRLLQRVAVLDQVDRVRPPADLLLRVGRIGNVDLGAGDVADDRTDDGDQDPVAHFVEPADGTDDDRRVLGLDLNLRPQLERNVPALDLGQHRAIGRALEARVEFADPLIRIRHRRAMRV